MLRLNLRRLLAFTGLVVIGLIAAAPQASAAGEAAASPNPARGREAMTITAGGFAPGSFVDLNVVDVTLGKNVGGGSVTADGNGNATFTYEAPPISGNYRTMRADVVGLDGTDEPRKTSVPFTVGNGCAQPSCSSLPSTGLPLLPLGLGLLFLGGGFAVVRVARRSPGKASAIALSVAVAAAGVTIVRWPAAAQAAGTGSIIGEVLDFATGDPIENVCVTATSGVNQGTDRTDADGLYEITGLGTGAYDVITIDCSTPATFVSSTIEADVVDAEETEADLIEMEEGGNAFAVVTDEAGDPAEFTCMYSIDPSSPSDSLSSCLAFARKSGVIAPDPLFEGEYSFLFVNEDKALHYTGGVNSPSVAETYELLGGDLVTLPIELVDEATVSGTVIDDATGEAPTEDVCVADLANDELTFASSRVDFNGSFTIGNLPAGNHKFKFGACGDNPSSYTEQFFDHKDRLSNATVVALTEGQARPGVNATLAEDGVPNPPTTTTSTTSTTSTTTTTSTTVPPTTTTSTTSTTTTLPTSTSTTAAPTSTTSTTLPSGSTSTTAVTTTSSTTSTTAPATTTTTAPGATTTTAPPSGTTSTTVLTRLTPTGSAAANPASAPIGGSVTVQGTGFGPNTSGQAVIFSTPIRLGSFTANASGAVSFTFRIPSGLAAGSHEVQLQGVNASGGARVLSATLTVQGLSRTGDDSASLIPIALVALLLGATMTQAMRKRPVGSHFLR